MWLKARKADGKNTQRTFMFVFPTFLWFVGLLFLTNSSDIDLPQQCWESWHQRMTLRTNQMMHGKLTDFTWFNFSGIVTDFKVEQQRKQNKEIHKSILLVHVGKTCGSSVSKVLDAMNISYTHLHIYPLDDRMIEQFDYIFITVRDPFNRSVSAYNFHNPKYAIIANSQQNEPDLAGHFYGCFPTISDYGNHLYANSTCGKYARYGLGHLRLGICSYVGGVMNSLMKHRQKVFVIDTETCELDLTQALDTSGINNNSLLGYFPQERSYPHTLESVSSYARRNMLEYLEKSGEYPLYRYLLSMFPRASNGSI
jgi:hypothetical protein